ncbi:MAG: DUF4276 family protein [Acidobacteria bacterium]|nr:DUF4276 family protein [Acidobacteriota bacterium]
MSFFRIFPIVTGHGEVRALPVLLARIIREVQPEAAFSILKPWRCRENQLIDPRSPVLENAVRAGIQAVGTEGAVFVVLDCEDDCPARLGPALRERIQGYARGGLATVVCAFREYETWFLWSLESMVGEYGLSHDAKAPNDPESCRGAKEWLASHIQGGSYAPTIDQEVLTNAMDIKLARRSDSFDKLYREVESLVGKLHGPTPR